MKIKEGTRVEIEPGNYKRYCKTPRDYWSEKTCRKCGARQAERNLFVVVHANGSGGFKLEALDNGVGVACPWEERRLIIVNPYRWRKL